MSCALAQLKAELMKKISSQCVRISVLAILFCVSVSSNFALAAGRWQGLVDEYAVLMGQGHLERALKVAQSALATAESDPVKNPKNLTLSLFILANTYQNLGQHDKALPLYQRLLTITEKALGPNHSDTALSLNNLAETYGNLGQHEKALPLHQRALELFEKNLGQDHPITASSLNNLAATYINLGQYDKALPLYQRSLAIREQVLGSEHPDISWILNNLAYAYAELAQHEKALQLQQRALAINEKSFGPVHLDTARSLNNLASTYASLAQYDKALPLYQRSLLIREKALGPEHPETAFSLNNLAGIYGQLAQYKNAIPLEIRALAIREKVLGPEHPETALGLNNLAATYASLAQYDKALPLHQRSLAIREKVLGPEHPDTALSLNNLAATFVDLSQYDQALTLQIRALAIREKTVGPEHPDTAISLNNLATTYGKQGQYEKALVLQQRALAIEEKIFGSEHPNTARSLSNVADSFASLAQYDKTLEFQERALAINEKTLGQNHPLTAVSLGNLASTYSDLALYDKALPLKMRALAIREKVLGPEHPNTANSLNNLAEAYVVLAQYDKALPLQQRAFAIYEKALGLEHPDSATSLNNLALTYNKLAQREKALPLQHQVLLIREKVLGPEHPATATALGNLAETYVDLVQYDKALPLQQRALAISEKALGQNHPQTAVCLNNLAFTLKDMGQPHLAIAFFKSAVNVYQNQREQVAQIDAPVLRSYTESVTDTYQALANLLIDQGFLPDAQLVLDMLKEEEQFDFIRRSTSADPRRTRIGYNMTEQLWMTRYRQIADQLSALGAEEQVLQKQAKLGLSATQKQRLAVLSADLQVAQAAFQSFLKEMRENFARLGPAKAADASETSVAALAELQGLLKGIDQDAVLLQYYVTQDKVGMLLTTPGVQLARSTNVSAKELNRQIAEFRRVLRDPKADVLRASQALYQLLVAPVAQDLEQAGAKTVMLSLDGALRYLPFGALHDGKRYMVERWNLPIYTSVTKNRLRDPVTPNWTAAGLGVTLALGEFAALPAVQAEMNSIVKTASGGVLPGEVYLDKAFTAQRLQDVSQRPFQLLHVASHFQFSPGTEVNSFLLLGDGKQLTLGDIRTQNYRFDNVDLLTLSACDTGLGGGRDAQGKEIEGFGVLAQQQGAKAVLATLWPVVDASTAALMAEMYRRRQAQSLTKIEALRQAQLSLLSTSKYAHPHYWAPFILMGNWK